MPNHVHLLMAPIGNHALPQILHSLKSFTAHEINKIIGRGGPVWERESFDHLIRSESDWEKFREYIDKNPVEAELCKDSKDWPFGSYGAGFRPSSRLEFAKPEIRSCAEFKSRGELPHLYREGGTYFITFRLADAVRSNESK
jgi:hypothetical protein